jgi:copper chaperone CopZ
MRDPTIHDGCEILRHPLRGLASDGAEPAVREALGDVDGILSIEVSVGHAVVEVTFDPRRVTADQVRARLRMAGVRRDFIDEGGHREGDS